MSPSPSGTGHRSLNPNVTPPGLRPGAREGEPQARRCRSRVSVPSSAVERGPGRSARPVGRRHAQASRAGRRPGRTEPPRGDRTTGARQRGSGREVRRPPPRELSSPRRRAPCWRSRRPPRAVRNRMSPSPSGTGHRSLNPNVTPPGLRPGAREGEPQARRCRSRVSVPSSAVERGPGRSARPVGRRHAQASRAGQRPGRTEPPRGDRTPGRSGVAAGGKCAGHRRVSCPGPRRRAPCWRSRRPPRAVREPGVAVTVGHRTPVTEPQRHFPRSTTGGAGGRAAGEAMPFPRQRSVVGRWTGAQVGGSTRRAPPCASSSCWPTPCSSDLTRRPLWPQAATRRGRRQGAVVDGGTPALISARFAVDWGVTCRGLAAGLRLFSLTRTRRSRGVLWPGHADLLIGLGWRRVRLALVRTGGGDD